MMQLERDVEQYLRRQVERRGGLCLKFIPDVESGMPDRIVLLPAGQVVWVELKNGVDETSRPLQQYQHRRLRQLGQRVEVVQTREQVGALMTEFDNKKGR